MIRRILLAMRARHCIAASVALLVSGLWCLVPEGHAGWQSRDSNYNNICLSLTGAGGACGGGGGNDPATTAWVNAVVSAGGTVSGTQQTRVNTLIVALKAHGIFTQLDCLWLWAGESDHRQATIDIINAGSGGKCVGTENGNLTSTGLSASGYTGNGTTGYFDSGFGPATGPNGTTASAMAGFYITSARSSGGGQFSGVQDIGTGILDEINPANFGSPLFFINNGFTGGAAVSVNGMWVNTQLSGTATLYNFSTTNGNNGSIDSQAHASPVIPVTNFYFCGFNGAGVPSGFMTDTLAAGYLGGGGINVASFAADLNAYMAAWGLAAF